MWDFVVFLVDTAVNIASTLFTKATLSDLALKALGNRMRGWWSSPRGGIPLGCPIFPNLLPVCLLICRVFDLLGRLDRFENVDMSTIKQIWLFLAGGRPGTKFYVGISTLNFFPGIKHLMISPFQTESLHKILYQAYHLLKKVKSAQILTWQHFQICRVSPPNKKLN